LEEEASQLPVQVKLNHPPEIGWVFILPARSITS